jgi:hypothetical protein
MIIHPEDPKLYEMMQATRVEVAMHDNKKHHQSRYWADVTLVTYSPTSDRDTARKRLTKNLGVLTLPNGHFRKTGKKAEKHLRNLGLFDPDMLIVLYHSDHDKESQKPLDI